MPAAVIVRGSSPAPVRSYGPRGDLRALATLVVGSYATGGVAVTTPGAAQGFKLRGVNVLNPIPSPSVDRVFSWDGSTSAPKIGAKVISTGAEVANATDLSAVTLTLELVFGG